MRRLAACSRTGAAEAILSRAGAAPPHFFEVMVSPEGKVFYHRKDAERFYGRPFSHQLGYRGQVRTAQLQAKEQIQCARAAIKAGGARRRGSPSMWPRVFALATT